MILITRDDLTELYAKVRQRGLSYILSKLNIKASERVRGTFNEVDIESSYAWAVPKVRQRWNEIISGDKQLSYEDYFVAKYLKERKDMKLLSLGSGVCSHELLFAKHSCFKEVKCVDFSDKALRVGEEMAMEAGLTNMVFCIADVNAIEIPPNTFDMVMFHSSLHHFKNVDLLLDKVKTGLKKDGFIVLYDFVGPNRIQLRKAQLQLINYLLHNEVPEKYKRRYITNLIKKRVTGPGYLRMIISDPSEAVESEKILPEIHKRFRVLEEKKVGGNIIIFLLKDIAHNFLDESTETVELLEKLFRQEDNFLKSNAPDLIFGVYQKPEKNI
jgi:ubiquinone/menaquinone biosynthesis C-methylase UbiE